jgi:hypothetical protein
LLPPATAGRNPVSRGAAKNQPPLKEKSR